MTLELLLVILFAMTTLWALVKAFRAISRAEEAEHKLLVSRTMADGYRGFYQQLYKRYVQLDIDKHNMRSSLQLSRKVNKHVAKGKLV